MADEPVAPPTVEEVANLLGLPEAKVVDAYQAEVEAQARQCRTEIYNPSLASALVRRVKRAKAMENVPLGVVMDEAGAVRLGFSDPEIRRLEGPYRRVPVG